MLFSNYSWYHKNFYFVFTPSYSLGYRSRRFLISGNKLEDYIGRSNAKLARLRASNLRGDKFTLKLRKYGTINIYPK